LKRRFRSQRGVASKSDSVIMGPHICSGVTSSLHSPISYLDWFATQSQERALYPRFAKAVQDRTSGRRIPQQGGHIAQHAGSWDIGRPRPPPRGIDRSGPALAMRPIRGGQLHRAEPRRKVMPYPRPKSMPAASGVRQNHNARSVACSRGRGSLAARMC
jgi:hypothetical protein